MPFCPSDSTSLFFSLPCSQFPCIDRHVIYAHEACSWMVKRAACRKEEEEEDVEEDPVPTPFQSTFRSASGMGTQFEYVINLLKASPGSEAFPFCGLDERGYPRKGKQKESIGSSSSARILESMGEPIDENSQESIRRKMQMQEDIFRKQVRELHRLYGIQKKLMGELKKEMDQRRLLSTTKSHQADYVNWPTGCTFHLQRLNDDRGSQERSGSSSREAVRMEIRPSRGDNTVIDMDDRLDGESDVELTLSIGGRFSKRKSNSYSHHQRELEIGSSKMKNSLASIMSDHRDACNSNTSNIEGSSTTSDQEKKWPHRLFQG